MFTPYALLVTCFLLSIAGGAAGAYANSPIFMVLGSLPGLLGLLGLMAVYGRK